MATPHLREREQSLRGWYKLLQVGCARVDPQEFAHPRAAPAVFMHSVKHSGVNRKNTQQTSTFGVRLETAPPR
jgi:hypothetical protein